MRPRVVIDVDSGEVITRGLSMPQSPRWYAGRYPELVHDDAERIVGSFVLPDEALDGVPAPIHDPARAHRSSNETPTIHRGA
jgi:hypothetical protein